MEPEIEENPAKRPVWEDEDDEVAERAQSQAQSSKKFKKIVGEPKWAVQKDESSDSEDGSSIYTTKLEQGTRSSLRPTVLGFKKVRNLNRSTYTERKVTSILFHPTSMVSICTGLNGIVNVYAVDGKKNEKLHSVGFKDFQITKAELVGGQELIVGSKRPFFYTYDLLTSKSSQIHLPKTMTKLKEFAFSPDEKLLAVKGRFGEIHLLSTKTKELVRTLKQETNVSTLTFSTDSKKIFSHSVTNEVSIFDLATMRLAHRFADDGCIQGRQIAVTENLVATGSAEGVVNVYEMPKVFDSKYPAPRKSILNLTTQITDLKFNVAREILAISSAEIADAVKLVHFPSATVFSNFPGNMAKLGKASVMAFSPKSGYLAIGNTESTVSLFRLKHYENY